MKSNIDLNSMIEKFNNEVINDSKIDFHDLSFLYFKRSEYVYILSVIDDLPNDKESIENFINFYWSKQLDKIDSTDKDYLIKTLGESIYNIDEQLKTYIHTRESKTEFLRLINLQLSENVKNGEFK